MSRAEELADALEVDGWEKPSDYEVADELRRHAAPRHLWRMEFYDGIQKRSPGRLLKKAEHK